MPKRPFYSCLTALLLAVLLAIQPLCTPPVLDLFLGNNHKPAHAAPPAQDAAGSLFLPVILNNASPSVQPADAPDFVINSPINGSAVGGVTFFAIQPTNGATIDRVTFRAGVSDLGTDTTAGDGFRLFLNARNLPAGATELTATASGPGGETTKSINVTIVPNPPQSATIGTAGGVLASEIGSVISLLPGSVPEGTTVTVDELTQAETTTRHGIDWESMGVTFLGAQDVQASAPISGPFGMVASAGFGNRVQPGQAVVNYRIAPDADGDGADEIVVVNTASVAPNGDVVADPITQVRLEPPYMRVTNSTVRPISSIEQVINVAPGDLLEIGTVGMNPIATTANIGLFRAAALQNQLEVPVATRPSAVDGTSQRAVIMIPPLPVGTATLQLYNKSSNSRSQTVVLNIQTAPSVQAPANVIDTFLSTTLSTLTTIREIQSQANDAQAVNRLNINISEIEQIRQMIQTMAANPTSDQGRFIEWFAASIQNTEAIYPSTQSANIFTTPQGICDLSAVHISQINNLGWLMLGVGLGASILGAAIPPLGIGLLLSGGLHTVGITWLLLRDIEKNCPPCKNILAGSLLLDLQSCPVPQCEPSQSPSPSGPTGMGAAPPPGGPGCGGSGGSGGSNQLTAANLQQASPVMVKIFSNGNRTPFTGMTDPGGYFFVPFIPAAEPFTALAIDTATGETRTFKGTGPATGESVFMFFDFFHDDGSGATRIQIGDVITGEISTSRELDLFSFVAAPGQRVYFDLQDYQGLSSQVNWLLTAPDGTEVFNTCLGCFEPGVKVLSQGGTYILTVGDTREASTGTYRFQLWNVPPPHEFAINIGDVISDSVPGPGAGRIEVPGAEDIYRFTANPGQRVFFDLQDYKGLSSQVNWHLTAPDGTEVFDTCLACFEPGVKVLSQGGTYTLTVGDTQEDSIGTYRFQLWNVPPPNEFTINIGDVISDSVPGPGAGRIEVPGAEDIYRFTANPGQHVFFDLQDYRGLSSQVNWRLTAPDGTEVFDTCLGCFEPGVKVLSQGGTYMLTVGDTQEDSVGTYRFQLWNVPPPNEFTINIGDVISNGVPGPGAGNIETPGVEDHYRFPATAGQRVRFEIKANAGLGAQVNWRLTAPNGDELFDTCIGCSNPGVQTLAQNGTYLLVIGDPREDSSGTYHLELIEQ